MIGHGMDAHSVHRIVRGVDVAKDLKFPQPRKPACNHSQSLHLCRIRPIHDLEALKVRRIAAPNDSSQLGRSEDGRVVAVFVGRIRGVEKEVMAGAVD